MPNPKTSTNPKYSNLIPQKHKSPNKQPQHHKALKRNPHNCKPTKKTNPTPKPTYKYPNKQRKQAIQATKYLKSKHPKTIKPKVQTLTEQNPVTNP